jgi:hypothetical protein
VSLAVRERLKLFIAALRLTLLYMCGCKAAVCTRRKITTPHVRAAAQLDALLWRNVELAVIYFGKSIEPMWQTPLIFKTYIIHTTHIF